jgi:hypothetical protein
MKRFNGGTRVGGGYYWNLKTWEVTTIGETEGMLPGGEKDVYLHAPLPVLFIVAPVMGLGFAMFLPLIGFVMPIYAFGKRVLGAGAKAAADVAATVAPPWQPGEAYLAGKPGEKKEPAEKQRLEALAKEIEERRAE